MNKHFKTTGIIIRKFNLNEADRIVTVLTKDQGKIDCIAKGARRYKNKLNGRLELFYEVELTCFQGKNLACIKEATILRGFSEPKSLKQHQALFSIAEITNKLIQVDQHIEGCLSLLVESLHSMQDSLNPDTILFGYLIKLLTLIGFLPPWNQCIRCEKKLNLQNSVFLTAADAHLSCSTCHHQTDREIETSFVKWVNFMQHYPLSEIVRVKADQKETNTLWQWLQGILDNLLGKPIKSEACFSAPL